MASTRRRHVRRRDDDDATGLDITYPLIEARPIVKCNSVLDMLVTDYLYHHGKIMVQEIYT